MLILFSSFFPSMSLTPPCPPPPLSFYFKQTNKNVKTILRSRASKKKQKADFVLQAVVFQPLLQKTVLFMIIDIRFGV